jgi:hypothetical protein
MIGKVNRKWVWLLLAAAVLIALSLAATGYAQDEIRIVVNGKTISSDVPPQIVDGRTMVPLRAVAEALGCQVNWDEGSRSVIITQSPSLPLLTVNGEPTTWPYWYEDGGLYMEYHDAIEVLRMLHSTTQISIGYSPENQCLTINNAVITIPYVQRGSFKTISLTYLYVNRNLIRFKFDPQTGGLTLLPTT